MAALVIKNLPDDIHAQLKARAKQNRRSMTKEAIVLLENALQSTSQTTYNIPDPFEGSFQINDAWLDEAKANDRA